MNAKILELVASKFFLACAFVSVLSLFFICAFLFANGIPAIAEIGVREFLLGTSWAPNNIPQEFGVLPMVVTSVYITLGAIILGVPVGIFTAVFLAYICPKNAKIFIRPVINLLASIPSVVYGFFGMVIIVPFVRNITFQLNMPGTGDSILAASILLGIMILPTIVTISETAIRAVPRSYYEGSLALGASETRSIFFAVVPAAKSGILASVILGIGRAVGETMAVVLVAGNQPRIPQNILQGARSLTANIVMEMGYAVDLHRDALVATGVVLFVFIFIINIIFTFLTRKKR